MRIILSGYNGRMGKNVAALCAETDGVEIVCGVDKMQPEPENRVYASFDEITEQADCMIDFSHHSLTGEIVQFAVKANLPCIIATTGQTPEEKAMITAASAQIPVFFAANYAIGVALLISLAKQTAAVFPDADIEIVEKHHTGKEDAPSGTALAIADKIKEVRPEAYNQLGRSGKSKRQKNEIGIHALRLANVVGEHEVIVATPYETITLKHEAHTRILFAKGAVEAAKYLVGKKPGLYDMEKMIHSND